MRNLSPHLSVQEAGKPPTQPNYMLELLTHKVNHTEIKLNAIFDLLFSQCDRHQQVRVGSSIGETLYILSLGLVFNLKLVSSGLVHFIHSRTRGQVGGAGGGGVVGEGGGCKGAGQLSFFMAWQQLLTHRATHKRSFAHPDRRNLTHTFRAGTQLN